MKRRYREGQQTLYAILLALLSYTLARALFLAIDNSYLNGALGDPLVTILVSIRFDLATIAYTLTPGCILLLFGFGLKNRTFKALALWSISIPQALGLALNLGDIAYFRHAYRRQTDEIFSIPAEAFTALAADMSQWWWLGVLLVVIVLGFHFTLKFTLKQLGDSPASNRQRSNTSHTLLRLTGASLFVALAFLAARGGLQNRPLRPAMAFTSDNLARGHLALNSFYTFLWSTFHPVDSAPELIDPDEALSQARKLLADAGSSFMSPEYPFLRKQISESEATAQTAVLYNVVILIFESWNASQTGAISTAPNHEASLTPNFDSLSRDGLLFTNFAANGSRSIHAFPAILASLPNIAGDRLMHSTLELNQIRGLGSILKERGYKTGFAMGAEATSMGFDSFARACGFDEYLSLGDFPLDGPEHVEENWGVYDTPFLLHIENSLAERTEPFAQIFFSLSAHSPFNVPVTFAKTHSLPDTASAAARQLRAARYADFALGEFMRAASTRPYFERTLFVITADHVGWQIGASGRNQREKFHIPLLLYAPGMIESGIDSLPASQVDILPTVVDILGIESTLATFGLSRVAGDNARFSLSTSGALYNFTRDSMLLVATADSALALYNYQNDSLLADNLIKREPAAAAEMWVQFASYYQVGLTALIDNRVYPAPFALDSLLR